MYSSFLPNKNDCHDITEMLLKVVLNTIKYCAMMTNGTNVIIPSLIKMSAVDANPSTQLVILCHIMGGCYIKESQSTLHPTQRKEYENLEEKKNENIPINTENNNAASEI
jgi:hypothetical protein